jgi:pyrroline-5-carboxylate reductase
MAALSRILLVGHGRMGRALLDGWQRAGLIAHAVVVDPSSEDSAQGRSADLTICRTAAEIPSDFQPDIVVLAVKPQSMGNVLPAYIRYAGHAVFLSIAAGKTIGFFEKYLGSTTPIVRAMPNLPASIGQGTTVLVANAATSPAQRDLAAALLAAVGVCFVVDDEQQIDAVTALSGSGPAYVFLLAEILAKAGEGLGLAPDLSAKLARSTLTGSAQLLAVSADSPADLRVAVTSPGGTTEAALSHLMGDGALLALFQSALHAAAARARALSE